MPVKTLPAALGASHVTGRTGESTPGDANLRRRDSGRERMAFLRNKTALLQ